MTEYATADARPPAAPDPAAGRRAATASLAGTTLEFYDFTIYGVAAALVFGQVFFPSVSPTAALLSAFATFGVGFVMRPVGGILFGHLGDRYGRKSTLVTTLIMMGTATVLIGCLPSYATIGFWAPVLLVVLRMVQGLAYGGEWGGAVLMSAEHASPARRGLFAALPNIGLSAGSLLGNLAFLLVGLLGSDAVAQYAWRLPFLFGGLLVIIGVIVRFKVTESPEFTRNAAAGEIPTAPVVEVFRTHGIQLLLVAGVMAGLGAGAYINLTYSIGFARGIGIDPSIPLTGVLVANAVQLVVLPVLAVLSDRLPRKKMLTGGLVLWAVMMLGFFPALQSGDLVLLLLAFALPYGIAYSLALAAAPAIFTESFDPRVGYSGLSIGFQLGVGVAGFSPFLAALLNSVAGPTVVGVTASALLLMSAVCGVVLVRRNARAAGEAQQDRDDRRRRARPGPRGRDLRRRGGGTGHDGSSGSRGVHRRSGDVPPA